MLRKLQLVLALQRQKEKLITLLASFPGSSGGESKQEPGIAISPKYPNMKVLKDNY